MSFWLTTKQIRDRTKTVTRRIGWHHIKPGDLVRAVRKGMGLKKGEKIEELAVIRIRSVTREPLKAITDDLDYGFSECDKEGFGDHPVYGWPSAFVQMFCATHKSCKPESVVTRIEFEYV